ncbi:MAG: Dabb family protein [Planctomycetota bacterium]|nr:Dabb family protein [Planctomycetota bacterium]
MLAHAVYFTLRDASPAGVRALVAACHQHLSGHEGLLHYSAGTRDAGLARDVNDREFEVALITVFEDRAAHDRYQTHPRHLAFIAEQGPNFKQVRVFDAATASA